MPEVKKPERSISWRWIVQGAVAGALIAALVCDDAAPLRDSDADQRRPAHLHRQPGGVAVTARRRVLLPPVGRRGQF